MPKGGLAKAQAELCCEKVKIEAQGASMSVLFLCLLVFAVSRDSLVRLDEGRPLALFADILDGCTLVVTVENIFFLQGNVILSRSPTSDLIVSVNADAQAAALFVDQTKQAVIAVADSSGGISFSRLKDCASPFELISEWTLKTGANMTSAVRSGEDVVFSGSRQSAGKAVFVGWIQGALCECVWFCFDVLFACCRYFWVAAWGKAGAVHSS